MRRMVIGILAHVDAGKTTLAEAMLYHSGRIRSLGRVDHRNSYLDTEKMERERGITIFSKQAVFDLGDMHLSLLDTPGHVDFSAEMERTLSVLDAAILLVSGTDGIQGHTETLWELLSRYGVPVILFVNKMDMPGVDRESVFRELKDRFGSGVLDFGSVSYSINPANLVKPVNPTNSVNSVKLVNCADSVNPVHPSVKMNMEKGEEMKARPEAVMPEELRENIALLDEKLLESYLEDGVIRTGDVSRLIRERRLFPCFFGSALRMEGVAEFLSGLQAFLEEPPRSEEFAARVYKITKDASGKRMTHLKIDGGRLMNRMELFPGEKVTQIRVYSGTKYEAVESGEAGEAVAVAGLTSAKAGDVFGAEESAFEPGIQPVLDYEVFSDEMDSLGLYQKLSALRDELPELSLSYDQDLSEIHVHLMGEVQTEILQGIVKERFGIRLSFGEGKILYLETIQGSVEGVGHFEPLRHYAEVHLLMEALPRGSGLRFEAHCPEDMLARNWQRLVLTHLREKTHIGVLAGFPITDMKITLIAGRAHLKHTEGGDFREATYRAVRQGLRKATCMLLEPYYRFTLELPLEQLGRAMTDISNMHGSFELPGQGSNSDGTEGGGAFPDSTLSGSVYSGSGMAAFGGMYESPGSAAAKKGREGMAVLRGRAPVAGLRNYAKELAVYSHGRGRLYVEPGPYGPCHNEEELLSLRAYDPDADLLNPCSSVFCAHGSGFLVPYDMVERYMHVESPLRASSTLENGERRDFKDDFELSAGSDRDGKDAYRKGGRYIGDQELEDIFINTYGNIRDRSKEVSEAAARTVRAKEKEENLRKAREQREGGRAGEVGTGHSEAGRKDYLLVDGYNIIFAWKDLKELAEANLDAAREKLLEVLSNYQGFAGNEIIVVFDAYRLRGHAEEVQRYDNIFVVYTKEAQTADAYIEKQAQVLAAWKKTGGASPGRFGRIGQGGQDGRAGQTRQVGQVDQAGQVSRAAKKASSPDGASKTPAGIQRPVPRTITIATGDGVVQVITWSKADAIWSPAMLHEEVERNAREVREGYLDRQTRVFNYVGDFSPLSSEEE